VSIEVLARLRLIPRMEALLNALPPKLLALSAAHPAEPAAWESHAGGRHVEHAKRCIQDAHFTGKGDKSTVVGLYMEYVDRTVSALSKSLAFGQASASDSDAGVEQLAAPLPVPPAAGMRLEAGQLVALTPELSGRRDGGGGGVLVAVVGVGGHSADGAVGGGSHMLSLECLSQVVLPWQMHGRPDAHAHADAEEGWLSRPDVLRRDVDGLSAVDERMRRMRAECAIAGGAEAAAATEAAEAVAVAEAAEVVVAAKTAVAAELGMAVELGAAEAANTAEAANEAAAANAAREVLPHLTASSSAALVRLSDAVRRLLERETLSPAALDAVVGTRQLEVAAAEAHGASGARGRYRYAATQLLSVRVAAGEWVDVEVAPAPDANGEAAAVEEADAAGEMPAAADVPAAAEVPAAALHQKIALLCNELNITKGENLVEAIDEAVHQLLGVDDDVAALSMEEKVEKCLHALGEEAPAAAEVQAATPEPNTAAAAAGTADLQKAAKVPLAAKVTVSAPPAAASATAHSLRRGPLREGWLQLTHGPTHNARRYVLVWPERVDVYAESGSGAQPVLTLPLRASTDASLATGGTRLTLRDGDREVRLAAVAEAKASAGMGAWLEAVQRAIGGADERLELALHPWNHAPRELPLDTFEEMRAWHTDTLRAQHATIKDALSGKALDVLRQLVPIEVEGSGEQQLGAIKDASGLARLLGTLHAACCEGADTSSPAAVLLTAGPAAGKTSLLSQLVVHLLTQSDEPPTPIVVKVQLLQLRLREGGDAFAGAWNWVDAYLRAEHGHQSALYRMLRQAMLARRAVLLVDGLDEGGEARDAIERHVIEVLAPQGHVMLCTSRPDGIKEERYRSFRRLRLAPLTEAQQREAFEQRLGAERARAVVPYLSRLPTDGESERRITANPLMLSMVASIVELREGLELPQTNVELYEAATRAMLARAGGSGSALSLRPLLQALFFEAHTKQQRVITAEHLEAAAARVGEPRGSQALLVLKERVAADRMPLLSLLETQPLRLQAAHLSFQEFFAAQAVCEGATLPLPPWELPPWWANTIRLGTGAPPRAPPASPPRAAAALASCAPPCSPPPVPLSLWPPSVPQS
jgi:hypothetical protein